MLNASKSLSPAVKAILSALVEAQPGASICSLRAALEDGEVLAREFKSKPQADIEAAHAALDTADGRAFVESENAAYFLDWLHSIIDDDDELSELIENAPTCKAFAVDGVAFFEIGRSYGLGYLYLQGAFESGNAHVHTDGGMDLVFPLDSEDRERILGFFPEVPIYGEC